MADTEHNSESDFMIEKIKEKPVNKKKLLRRTLITASMAVIFGLIACLTFLILEPVFSNWLYPEEEPAPIEFVDETEEMLPEDMMTVEEETGSGTEEGVKEELDDDQIKQVLSQVEFTLADYQNLYGEMSKFSAELSRSMVTVIGAKVDKDWFNDTYESESYASGIIIADREQELFILVDRTPIAKAETISVEFSNGYVTEAKVKGYDVNTNLAIVCVDASSMKETNREAIQVAAMGSSNGRSIIGSAVIALGSPIGINGSVCYGNVTSANIIMNMTDANYRLLTTDIVAGSEGSGMLFNLKGQLIGVLYRDKSGQYGEGNTLSAIGISELKKVIEKMSNEKKTAYMGISGIDVTTEANVMEGIPLGAYVLEIEMDSPAMKAGIQRGDIITEVNDAPVTDFGDYMTILLYAEADSVATVKLQRQVQGGYKEMLLEIPLGTVE